MPFLCQIDSKITGNKNISLKFYKEDITFPFFKVMYKYQVSNLEMLDFWEDESMTGFRLSWFLEDSNGTRLTEILPDLPEDWKPAQASIARYKEPYLDKMVELASRARNLNMTPNDIIRQTITEKTQLIQNGHIDFASMCSGNELRINKTLYLSIFAHIKLGINDTMPQTTILDEDIKTGRMMFSAVVFCSESTSLYMFLYNLLTNESPRTILQATANTIESATSLTDDSNKQLIHEFYHLLENVFNLQLGKILLATVTKPELERMLAKKWPYFTRYSQQIHNCFNGQSCIGINDILTTLGRGLNNIKFYFPQIL